jgi:hypothetical protein
MIRRSPQARFADRESAFGDEVAVPWRFDRDSVSTPRSSNRTGSPPASGSRTRSHAFAHTANHSASPRPRLSLTGVRMIIPDHACLGASRVAYAFLLYMLSPLPRRSDWTDGFRSVTPSCQPSGRPAHRPFRGLLGVHSRYGLHTRAVTNS